MAGTEKLVNVEVSTENMNALIQSKIEVAMLEALSQDSESLVETVVKLAMQRNCDNRDHNHNREHRTNFQCQVEGMIRESAQGIFRDWLTEHHTLIREAIEKRLGRAPKTFVNQVVEAVFKGLGENLEIKAQFKAGDRW